MAGVQAAVACYHGPHGGVEYIDFLISTEEVLLNS